MTAPSLDWPRLSLNGLRIHPARAGLARSRSSGAVGPIRSMSLAPANTYDPLTDVMTGGNGLDAVNVRATSGTLLVENYNLSGQGSPETDTIGSLAPGLGGTLTNLN